MGHLETMPPRQEKTERRFILMPGRSEKTDSANTAEEYERRYTPGYPLNEDGQLWPN